MNPMQSYRNVTRQHYIITTSKINSSEVQRGSICWVHNSCWPKLGHHVYSSVLKAWNSTTTSILKGVMDYVSVLYAGRCYTDCVEVWFGYFLTDSCNPFKRIPFHINKFRTCSYNVINKDQNKTKKEWTASPTLWIKITLPPVHEDVVHYHEGKE